MYDDGRARSEAAEVNDKGATLWRELSYRVQASWALPKLLWMVRQGMMQAGAKLLHQNDWLNLRLAGRLLATDSSNALKTGYDLLRSCWPVEVLESLGIEASVLPEVVPPGTRIGEVDGRAARETGLPEGTPIFAGMTDGCAAQIASGATGVGSWNTVIGTTLVVKGATERLLHDPLGVVYSHRSMDGLWLPGGASSTGAGAIAAEFAAEQLPALNAFAEEHGPTPLVVYPLAGRGERFPFAASDAEPFALGEAGSVEERYVGCVAGDCAVGAAVVRRAACARCTDTRHVYDFRGGDEERGVEPDARGRDGTRAPYSGGDGGGVRHGRAGERCRHQPARGDAKNGEVGCSDRAAATVRRVCRTVWAAGGRVVSPGLDAGVARARDRDGDERMKRLALVRHGETVWHAENRYAGSSDVALTAKGLEQAQVLGEWARGAELKAVWCSNAVARAEDGRTRGCGGGAAAGGWMRVCGNSTLDVQRG